MLDEYFKTKSEECGMRPKKVSKKSNFSVYLPRRRYFPKLRSGEGLFASWVSREKERQYKFAQETERQK